MNLSRNRIGDGDYGGDSKFCVLELARFKIKSLEKLFLFGNFIEEYALVDILKSISGSFPNMVEISLHGNPCIEQNDNIPDKFEDAQGHFENYTKIVKENCESIKVIDNAIV